VSRRLTCGVRPDRSLKLLAAANGAQCRVTWCKTGKVRVKRMSGVGATIDIAIPSIIHSVINGTWSLSKSLTVGLEGTQ
jgi:hypothetical protein